MIFGSLLPPTFLLSQLHPMSAVSESSKSGELRKETIKINHTRSKKQFPMNSPRKR